MRHQLATLTIGLVWPAAVVACELEAGPGAAAPSLLRKPVHGDDARLASGFGIRMHPLLLTRLPHTGIDWAARIGTPVLAAGSGRVHHVGWSDDLGLTIVLDHGAGWSTHYSHLSEAAVKEGDCVSRSAPIGSIGATGVTTGPMLHFEVRLAGEPLDPLYLPEIRRAR